VAKFDIATLLHFEPPKYMCKNCIHIFNHSKVDDFDFEHDWLRCPVCGKHHSSSIEFDQIKPPHNIVEHSRKLAGVASEMYKGLKRNGKPPIRVLMSAMMAAESFIHLTTYGMDSGFLGSLKIVSQTVQVKGVLSNAKEYIQNELDDFSSEHPNLEIITIPASNSYRKADDQTLHQKIIIIDGLLAFSGSTNLTFTGWRSAAKGRDYVQILTDIGDIRELHDRYFCDHWFRLNPSSQDFSDEIPF
jgi:rubredoxin